ncbi:hypothetical protein AN960_23315 [Bacillus sp. FJAT-25509]|uniref:hypothetical protein n=1 Tax=Bacillus sp. FJAT-25509 TaxID=1712029 RepID=UPI0006FF8698|nr:hypothetical protein [Bacillus sp. FJAT-25509]KQL32900.1 hypothetical protein AN960_23315 [Bacillus sp. FJAT-25509]
MNKKKKIFIIVLIVVFSAIILSGCGDDIKEKKSSYSIAAIVYQTLSDREKAELVDDRGKVEQKVVTNKIAHLTYKNYDGKEVYAVTFKTKNSQLAGDLVVYFDGETQKVIGKGIRE